MNKDVCKGNCKQHIVNRTGRGYHILGGRSALQLRADTLHKICSLLSESSLYKACRIRINLVVQWKNHDNTCRQQDEHVKQC